ncbi:ArsR family transcriptional regulator [Pyrodictium occultum]|uniref:ArsR family transcriptional regulator n=1 Tax=Pyrodictium occultum TaxID=2309 RepID=A0A0V8RV64_PYROC|nr:helix-turn-helix transcriptional regulator [Pyrodictium occultum]KSW11937.1 ArsR family transcriptional regulator [Pyrodictium occultum]
MSIESDELARILGSKGKIKILSLLARSGQLNITRIIKDTGLHHRLVEQHLEELKNAGLVEEQRIGRLRLFSLRYDNPKTAVLIELLRAFNK